MHKLIIVCGPTATGKTSFALKLAQVLSGEIISADSRQVYTEMDIVTGKDLPVGIKAQKSEILWQEKPLSYYPITPSVKLWLYDLVTPQEHFSVSLWKEAANLAIDNILSRQKTPIVVGGTGLYLKALTQPLENLSVPPNPELRRQLAGHSVSWLMNHLSQIAPHKAAQLTPSDQKNPRRLIRAIEVSTSSLPTASASPKQAYTSFWIGLTGPLSQLQAKISQRIHSRISAGAVNEAQSLAAKYGWDLPSMTASGYKAFQYPNWQEKWELLEKQYLKRQLTWFNKQPEIHWFDITSSDWQNSAIKLVQDWYNKK